MKFHAANSSIVDVSADTSNISLSVWMISVGRKMNSESPVSLNSIEYTYEISASPKAQSAEPPDVVYNQYVFP